MIAWHEHYLGVQRVSGFSVRVRGTTVTDDFRLRFRHLQKLCPFLPSPRTYYGISAVRPQRWERELSPPGAAVKKGALAPSRYREPHSTGLKHPGKNTSETTRIVHVGKIECIELNHLTTEPLYFNAAWNSNSNY